MEQHIHFWLGEEATQDEAAVAAFKTVELDEFLGGSPIQHREVQGQESMRFKAYFKSGLRYMTGGVGSGFSHYVPDLSPKLFQVKGRRDPILRQLKTLSWAEMNPGDSYIVDVPEEKLIFVWQGKQSNRFEKLKAATCAQKFKSEYGTTEHEVVILVDGQEDDGSEEAQIFNETLPLANKGSMQESSTIPDENDSQSRGQVKLYRCSDSEGKLILNEVKDGPLFQNDLNSDDTFLIDNGSYGIWVWIGKNASEEERREAMRNAQGFIKARNLKTGTPVTRVIDGGEPLEFKTLFQSWRDKDDTKTFKRQTSGSTIGNGVARTVQTKFDAKTLHENPKVAATNRMVDDGTGAKEVFRVEMFDLINLPDEDHGIFFSGDCYVVLYAYHDGSKDNYIIYYWIGENSSQDEQGAAALRTIELDQRLGGNPVQVRVVQGKEPQHFLAMFDGQMTVFSGGKASAFDGENGHDRGIPNKYMLQVRGTNKFSTRAREQEFRAASLNTNDCFVIVNDRDVVVWFGKSSTGDERDMAKQLALIKNPDPLIVVEGQEKNSFWEMLGGKENYFSEKVAREEEINGEPRLFHVSNASGNIRVDEIVEFTQQDLLDEDIMLLDSTHSIFVWVGYLSNRTERTQAITIAKEYLETCPIQRDPDTPIIIIKQGREPIDFIGYFGFWDETLWADLEELYGEAAEEIAEDEPVIINGNHIEESVHAPGFLSYAVLSSSECPGPDSVDPARKEDYLSDAEFIKVFDMNRDDFESLPNWKKQNLKKKVNLF